MSYIFNYICSVILIHLTLLCESINLRKKITSKILSTLIFFFFVLTLYKISSIDFTTEKNIFDFNLSPIIESQNTVYCEYIKKNSLYSIGYLLLHVTCDIQNQSLALVKDINTILYLLKEIEMVKISCSCKNLSGADNLLIECHKASVDVLLASLKVNLSNMINDLKILLSQLKIHGYEYFPKSLEEKLFDTIHMLPSIDSMESASNTADSMKVIIDSLNNEIMFFIMDGPFFDLEKFKIIFL